MLNKIKVMIIDDSALIRNLVSKELSKASDIEVVGTAINGRFALNKIDKLQPDILVLDLEMPEMNGIEFLKERQRLGIKVPVIILSSHAKKGAKITLDALSLGASDFILKPSEPGVNVEEMGNKLIELIHALAKPYSYIPSLEQNRVEENKNLKFQLNNQIFEPFRLARIDVESHLQPINNIPDIKIVVIGISTGGPNALREILPLFPENFPCPIVIVQHMPAGFTLEFANSLDKSCKLRVKEANNDDIVKQGRILIAPGNRHIRFIKKTLATVIQLDDSEPVNGHKPSVDVLFQSAAEVFGENTLACIMTGMGKDGATNIGLILKKGGITIAQDQDTSIVFGMPKVAIEKNNIQLVRPLNKIPETIINIVINKKII